MVFARTFLVSFTFLLNDFGAVIWIDHLSPGGVVAWGRLGCQARNELWRTVITLIKLRPFLVRHLGEFCPVHRSSSSSSEFPSRMAWEEVTFSLRKFTTNLCSPWNIFNVIKLINSSHAAQGCQFQYIQVRLKAASFYSFHSSCSALVDVPTIFKCSFENCKYSTDSQKKLNR